jgi:hypothetical protein
VQSISDAVGVEQVAVVWQSACRAQSQVRLPLQAPGSAMQL